MAPKKKITWRNSTEKKTLYKEIALGNLAGMPPREVWETWHNGVCQKFKYANFRQNLLALRKKVARDKMFSARSQAAFDNDKHHYSRPKDRFIWRGSPEQDQLRQDIKSGDLDDMMPMEVRQTRQVYLNLPINKTQWRNYLWQERRRLYNQLNEEERKKIIKMKTNRIFD